MNNRFSKALAAAFLICLVPSVSAAQTRHWVQVEAHPTRHTAEEWAARYESDFGNVAGFRLPGGWYALALGPFETAEDAAVVRRGLLADRMIPSDAYLTQDDSYGTQFWPVGAEPQAPPVVSDDQTATRPEPDAPEVPQTVEESRAIEAPEETLAEARANDARLTRYDRIEIQTALQWFGHYAMTIDAAFGPGTRRAIESWQTEEGFEATGFLTSRQRQELLQDHAAALARFDFDEWRDEPAGIEITLPLGMLAFDRRESPFVHFRDHEGSGLRVLLISQEGSQTTLSGLYDIMQTFEAIPMEGERARRSNSFTLTGQSATARAHVEARLQDGQIKGWALMWEPAADAAAERALARMQTSFRAIDGVLPADTGAPASTVARSDLLAGMEVRRPLRSRTGFFVDARGTVATTAEAVTGCGRITIDSAYEAEVKFADAESGIAVLTPRETLAPLAFARFSPNGARLDADIRVAGFSYADTLTRPILTRGQIAELEGLNGEPSLKRLAIHVVEGDSGGPVFDSHGAVVGMLLPRHDDPDRLLPDEVNFAISAEAVLDALNRAGLNGAMSRENASMPAETLTRVSSDLTVLVSCWR